MESRSQKILVLFYSLSGHTADMAREVAKGVSSVANTEVVIKRIPEILPNSFFDGNPDLARVRDTLHAEFKEVTRDDFVEADGILLGTPTHFGSFASQVKYFLDGLTPAWLKGKLVNKPVALFCSAGSMHGGEEVTLVSLMIPLLNLGMIPVGIPYPIQGEGPDFDAGSPYGAIFVSGHGRKPTEADKKVARILGARLTSLASVLSCGCEHCGSCRVLSENINNLD
ncbi:MAG: NAD(P)H:quinone oxidoreductase [Parcubacteria group bacterium]|nr:NAD(P)H:quinone oxidoreductase [Parcubacteria group bacterium]